MESVNKEYRMKVMFVEYRSFIVYWDFFNQFHYNYRTCGFGKTISNRICNGCACAPLPKNYWYTGISKQKHTNSEIALWLWTLRELCILDLLWPSIIYYLYGIH